MLEGMVHEEVDESDGGTERVDRVGLLLVRVALRDETAFARVYDMLAPRAFGLVMQTVTDPPQAEGVLQDVFLEVWRAAPQYAQTGQTGREWVLAIAQRRAHAAVSAGAASGEAEAETDAGPRRRRSAADAAPPLTLRSSLLAKVATLPQVPAVPASDAAAALAAGRPLPAAPVSAAAAGDAADAADAAPVAAADPVSAAAGRPSPSPSPAPSPEPPPTTTVIQAVQRRRWTRGLLAFVGIFLVLIAAGFTVATINEAANRTPEQIALDEIEAAPDAASATVEVVGGGTATAHWSPSLGTTVLVVNGLPDIADDEVFQIWWGTGPDAEPAGTFRAPRSGPVTIVLDSEWREDSDLIVTVEPGEGAEEPDPDSIIEIPTD